ncbi:hypothetical protein EK904_008414 [Melospiza melodia maxima]|nr:hypothetical protein EK904_008414 [Melospiza melodia maxima]
MVYLRHHHWVFPEQTRDLRLGQSYISSRDSLRYSTSTVLNNSNDGCLSINRMSKAIYLADNPAAGMLEIHPNSHILVGTGQEHHLWCCHRPSWADGFSQC